MCHPFMGFAESASATTLTEELTEAPFATARGLAASSKTGRPAVARPPDLAGHRSRAPDTRCPAVATPYTEAGSGIGSGVTLPFHPHDRATIREPRNIAGR